MIELNGGQQSDHDGQQPMRWGEALRFELKADIAAVTKDVAILKATATTHKDFMLWGAGLGAAILCAVIYLSKDTKEAVQEAQKDIRSLYQAGRIEKRQRRLETPPTTAVTSAVVAGVP